MKILVIYSLKGERKEGDSDALKEKLGVNVVVQVKAENQLEYTQYPVFEIIEI